MRGLYLLLLMTLVSLTACSNYKAGARFIPYNPLTYQQDSVKAAGLGVTLSKINEAIVIAHPANGGKLKIKNAFNSIDKSKDKSKTKADNLAQDGSTAIIDKPVNKDKSKVKADIIGDGNTKEESSYWWIWLPVVLVIVAYWLYKKVK